MFRLAPGVQGAIGASAPRINVPVMVTTSIIRRLLRHGIGRRRCVRLITGMKEKQVDASDCAENDRDIGENLNDFRPREPPRQIHKALE